MAKKRKGKSRRSKSASKKKNRQLRIQAKREDRRSERKAERKAARQSEKQNKKKDKKEDKKKETGKKSSPKKSNATTPKKKSGGLFGGAKKPSKKFEGDPADKADWFLAEALDTIYDPHGTGKVPKPKTILARSSEGNVRVQDVVRVYSDEGKDGISELAWTSPLTQYIIEAYDAC